MKKTKAETTKNKRVPWQEILTRDRNEELSPEQAAEEFGYTRQTLYLWLRRKGEDRLKGRKLSARKWRIRRGDLIDFLQAGQHREEDNYQPTNDPALRNALLHLITLAQAGLAWRQAREIYNATSGRLGQTGDDEWELRIADQELLNKCFESANRTLEELLSLIGGTSDELLSELRQAIEDGRVTLAPGSGAELILKLGEDEGHGAHAGSSATH